MTRELDSLVADKTFSPAPLLLDRKVVRSKWMIQ